MDQSGNQSGRRQQAAHLIKRALGILQPGDVIHIEILEKGEPTGDVVDATGAEQRRCPCGEDFEIDAGEARWFFERGFALPRYCRPCRQARKQEQAAAR